MPIFGEITEEELAISLKAHVDNDPTANEDIDNGSYQAPVGYVIISVREHEISSHGFTTKRQVWRKAPDDYTLNYDRFNDELHKRTEGLYDSVISSEKGYIYEAFKWTTDRKGARKIHAEVVALPFPGRSATIEVDYYVKLMYVGNEADVSKYLDEWLSGLKVEARFNYKAVANKLHYLNAQAMLQADFLLVRQVGGNEESGSVFFEIRCPIGSKAKFNARINTLGSSKTCEAVIWQIGSPEVLKSSSGRVLVDKWIDLQTECSTDSKGVTLRFEIYAHDNVENEMVIDLNSTKISIEKTF